MMIIKVYVYLVENISSILMKTYQDHVKYLLQCYDNVSTLLNMKPNTKEYLNQKEKLSDVEIDVATLLRHRKARQTHVERKKQGLATRTNKRRKVSLGTQPEANNERLVSDETMDTT